MKQNYASDFNINFERIKMMILLFCYMTVLIIYYTTNPGGLIDKYFGTTMLLSILIGIFAFIYLIVLICLSNEKSSIVQSQNLFSWFSNFSIWGSLLFFALLS